MKSKKSKNINKTYIRHISGYITRLAAEEYVVFSQHYIVIRNNESNSSKAFPHSNVAYVGYEDSGE